MDYNVVLATADYVVIVIMFLIPLGIGIWFAYTDRNEATREEYLLGGRKMSLFPISMSLFVTFQSAISLMGLPSDVYQYGAMFPMIYIGDSLSYVVGYFIMIPVLYPLKLTSLYEYLLLRFESQTLQRFSTVIGMTQTLFYMAVALFSPALALQTAASIPLWLSVVIVGVIGTVYTAIGGIKSVVWTDTFQTLVVFSGIFIILVKGCMSVGSVGEILSLARAGGRLEATEVSLDPRTRHTWWGMLIGGMFMWMANIFNQSTMQRISAMSTKREASICFILNGPLMIVYGMSLLLVGIIMFAYFSFLQCDPIKSGLLTDGNQILPFYVLHVLRDLPGMSGLYMGTLFSGGLSTISSGASLLILLKPNWSGYRNFEPPSSGDGTWNPEEHRTPVECQGRLQDIIQPKASTIPNRDKIVSGMNSLAANTVEDLLKGPMNALPERTVTLCTKAFVVLYGAIIVGLAYGASSVQGPVTQMSSSVFGACGGPIFGMFLMGLLVPWANKYGALAGGAAAIIFNIFLAITGQLYGRKPRKLPPVSTANCPNSRNISFVSSNYVFTNTSLGNALTDVPFDNYTTLSPTASSHILPSSESSLIGINTQDYGFFLFDISYVWYSLIGTTVALLVGLLVSYLSRGLTKSQPKPELLLPCMRRFCSPSSDADVKKVDLSSREYTAMPLKKLPRKDKH